MSKIYVASSWRNNFQPVVVSVLQQVGYEVYDFRHPPHGHAGFSWQMVDPHWQAWNCDQFRDGLNHPLAIEGFDQDMTNLQQADVVILVMPCGRSAHLELGYAIGAGKKTFILLDPKSQEPELMYKMVTGIFDNLADLMGMLNVNS